MEKEVQEDESEEFDDDELVTKPTAEEIPKATDTLINVSMFTENGEIGVVAMKASTLFEKELCDSLKQASISDFFKKY